MGAHTSKNQDPPEYLRQLALEIINKIPATAMQIYTDGSKDEQNSCGSGIFIKAPNCSHNIKIRNSDFCSVFRSELIAIDEALRIIKTMTSPDEIWILCDSRSAIQHLSDWTNVGDKTSVSILKNLKELSQQHEIYFQWIPSHIGLFGNDTADLLAKEGVTENLMSRRTLTFSEIFSKTKSLIQELWKTPPTHPWYNRQAPGGALSIKADRVVQTTISRLASGHIRGLSFNLGQKIYENCTKCNLVQATPDHLLFCAGLEREDIYSSPLLVYDFLRTLGLMDLVNHYPGSFHLGRKDRLWENYSRMFVRHGPEAFNFFPETYILPADLKLLKETWDNDADKCWIVKPCASARGTGVKVIYKWSQVPKNKPFVVQRYISDPYLINGSKFDLRFYVMVPSIEPLRIYVFNDGLVRFASEKYSLANKSFANRYIHLTNYSINKKSSSYTSNDDETMCQGHKWSLKSFWDYMSNSGIDVKKIKTTITDMIIKTIISAEGPICRILKTSAKSPYNCFELFGFDIMLDKDLHPWLLEVNISPSLHTKSKLDTNIKGPLVRDMFNIAGFEIPLQLVSSNNSTNAIVGRRHKFPHYRWLPDEVKRKHALYSYKYAVETKSDILSDLTLDDVQCLCESEDELYRSGSFTRVFPTENTFHYFEYFDHIRYYNVLLDAWEKTYHSNRNEGIKLLQEKLELFASQNTKAEMDSNNVP
ncbi:tubulin polyglutamylase TTLL4 [Trichonephila clavipes]|nr:tubulin polyglutamylase TTLL4 [Trichonephila clavipes]